MIKVVYKGDTRRILVASGKSVIYSDDEGLNWTEASGFDVLKNWGWIKRAIMVNDSLGSIYILGGEWDYDTWKAISSIYISEDQGESFRYYRKFDDDPNYMDIWASKKSDDNLYMLHRDTLFTLHNSGDTITEYSIISSFGIAEDNIGGYLMTGSEDSTGVYLYCVVRTKDSPSENFFFSDDLGTSWQDRGTLNFGPFTNNSFAVSYDDKNIVYYGGVEVFKSSDGAFSFKEINKWWEYYGMPDTLLHADIPAVDILPRKDASELTFINTDGGLYKSYNYGENVKNVSLYGLNISQYYSSLTSWRNPKVVYVGSQDQGFQRCLNDSGSALGFTQTISGDYGHLTSSDSGSSVWSVYPGFAMLYKNADADIQTYMWSFIGENRYWLPPIVAAPGNPDRAYLAGGGLNDESNIWQIDLVTTDSSVELVHTILPFNFSFDEKKSRVSGLAISDLNNGHWYTATGDGRFFASTDMGVSWTEAASFEAPYPHYFYGTAILPSKVDQNKVYVGGSGYSNSNIYVSLDNGKTFTPIDSGMPKTLIYKLASTDDDKFLFAATEAGPYIFSSYDSRWYPMSGTVAPDQTYWSVEYIPVTNTARFVTYGRGIWDFKISEFTGIEDGNVAESLNPFTVNVNPNPVKQSAEIIIDLGKEGDGYARIYDSGGRIVRNLYAGEFKSGKNTMNWELLSDTGHRLSSGAYLCIVSVGGYVGYAKIIIE